MQISTKVHFLKPVAIYTLMYFGHVNAQLLNEQGIQMKILLLLQTH